jgi:dTMP kinase
MSLTTPEQLEQVARRTIVVEGINGSGKTTLLAGLRDRFKGEGVPVCMFRDPGSHPVAQKLREVLKAKEPPLDVLTQVLLFMAARRLLLQELVDAVQAEPRAVLLVDRWFWSTLAYQGAQGVSLPLLNKTYLDFTPLPLACITPILLDLPVRDSFQRVATARGQDFQEDRFEAMAGVYMERVAALYRRVLPPYYHVDAALSAEAVLDVVWKSLARFVPSAH